MFDKILNRERESTLIRVKTTKQGRSVARIVSRTAVCNLNSDQTTLSCSRGGHGCEILGDIDIIHNPTVSILPSTIEKGLKSGDT